MPERKCLDCKRQVEWGCDAKQWRKPEEHEDPKDSWLKPADLPIEIDGEEVYACPRRVILDEPGRWSRLLLLYGMYQKGFLPEEGAVIDQSNRLVQLFRIMDVVNAECDEVKDKTTNRIKGDPFQPR